MRYNPTVHAVKRLKERMGVEPESAKNFVNQLMQTAKYVTTQADGNTVYHHANRNVMIVVDVEKSSVITLFSDTWTTDGAPAKSEETPPTAKLTIDRIAAAVKRELKRMTTQYRREIRKMTEQKAQLGVLVAELTLNYVRCDAPHTKALIQSRIDEAKAQIEALANDIDGKLTQVKRAETEVKAVVGELLRSLLYRHKCAEVAKQDERLTSGRRCSSVGECLEGYRRRMRPYSE